MATLLVTGGAGFIGSCYVLARCGAEDTVINLDKLTYSGNPENFASLSGNPRHIFVHGDIGNAELVEHLLRECPAYTLLYQFFPKDTGKSKVK